MTSEHAGTSGTTTSSSTGQTSIRKKMQSILGYSGLIIGAFGASAVVAAVVSGLFTMHENEQGFLRDQRVTAYSAFLNELLAFEETYEAGRRLLEPLPNEEAPASTSPTALSLEIGARLDSIRLAKASVDILGSPEIAERAREAIDRYGPYKGQMQEDLAILEGNLNKPLNEATPLEHRNHAAKKLDMQTCSREPFSEQARIDLKVPSAPVGPPECLPHP